MIIQNFGDNYAELNNKQLYESCGILITIMGLKFYHNTNNSNLRINVVIREKLRGKENTI